MPVIDVDSHHEPAFERNDHPLEPYLDRLPTPEAMALQGIAGDLLAATPVDELERLVPLLQAGSMSAMADMSAAGPPTLVPGLGTDVDERVRWLDRIGIDFQLVNPGGAFAAAVAAPSQVLHGEERHDAMRRVNDHLADWIGGHTDRLSPVTVLDYDDIEWSIGELARMRARGSRAVFVWAWSFAGLSPAHPTVDRLWSAMADHGMVGVVHIGATPAQFDPWSRAGWTAAGGTGPGGFLRFANSRRTEAAETMLAAMVFGGAFDRNPRLTLVLCELWAGWLPWHVSRIDMLAAAEQLGPYPGGLRPAELLRRNVKVSPLPGLGDDGTALLRELPEMAVFSSDVPHGEGNADPIALYEPVLAGHSDQTRTDFLGATMLECFARTGDPLTLAGSRAT